ncbi:MAG: site-2 protease family protein [Leptospirillia bacterium]
MDISLFVQRAAIIALPLLFAITLHEAAHGWMAEKKGDPTARMLGRVSANPLRHIDPFGTLILPLILLFSGAPFLFGWAKPVPVNFAGLRRPKIDMAWVAAAGPGTNLVLALASGVACHGIVALHPEFVPFLGGGAFAIPNFAYLDGFSFWLPLLAMLKISVGINILLMMFNLLPIPPLDGGRIAVGLLPERQARALAAVEPVGMILVVVIVFLDPGGLMRAWFWPAISAIGRWILVG